MNKITKEHHLLKMMYEQSEMEISKLLKEVELLKNQLEYSSSRTKYWKAKYRELKQSLKFAY